MYSFISNKNKNLPITLKYTMREIVPKKQSKPSSKVANVEICGELEEKAARVCTPVGDGYKKRQIFKQTFK